MSDAPNATALPVDDALLAAILSPYKPHCRYLERAVVEVPEPGAPDADARVLAHGDFAIPASCYIDDTGHFNSVEFNLCYNQLVYVLIGQCVAAELLPELGIATVAEYRRRQLPDVLIHDFQSVFKRPMDPRRFRGTVLIDDARKKQKFVFLETRCRFSDDAGGYSEGRVTLVVVDGPCAAKPR